MRVAWLYAALVAALALVASRTTFTHDLADLVPADGPLPEALELLEAYDVADILLLEVDGTGTDRATLLAATDALGAALAADPDFREVRYRVEVDDGIALQTALAPLATSLIPADRLAERLSPEGMATALQGQLARLAGPASALTAKTFPYDPLDLWGLATEQLRDAPGPFRVQVESGHFLDEGGTRALIFAWPDSSALVADPSGRLMARVRDHAAVATLPVAALGGHRIASESAAMIYRDLHRGGALGIACLVGIFLIGFRSLRPALGAPVPILLAIACSGALCALLAPIHAITLGFVAPVLGLAVDYWIHLVVETAAAAPGGDRLAAARAARKRLLPAYGLSAGSTALAFAVLTSSRYPVIRDLGWLGLAAVAGALAGTLLLGPLAAARLAPVLPLPDLPRPPASLLRAVVVAVTILALVGLPRGRFDGDPRALNGMEPETAALEATFHARYGGFGTGGLAVFTAPSLAEALDRADRAQGAVIALPGATAQGATAVLPSPTAIARRAAAMPADDALRPALEAAAVAAGFAPGVTAQALLPRPALVPPETWRDTPVEELVTRHTRTTDIEAEVMLTLSFDPGAAEAVAQAVRDADPSARVLVPAALAAQGVTEIRGELLRLGGFALAGILLLLGLRYRAVRPALTALAPALAAVVWSAGLLGWLGAPWTAVSTCAMVLILGLGLDYGVFMVEARRQGRHPAGRAPEHGDHHRRLRHPGLRPEPRPARGGSGVLPGGGCSGGGGPGQVGASGLSAGAPKASCTCSTSP